MNHPYGTVAEFDSSRGVLEATQKTRDSGYTKLEVYAPYPVEGLSEAAGLSRSRVPLFTLVGGILGGTGAYVMMWYSAVISYPLNVGGRPLHSWPSFPSPLS